MFSNRIISSGSKRNASIVTRSRKPARQQAMFETLEGRQLMSTSVSIGNLNTPLDASTSGTSNNTVDFIMNDNVAVNQAPAFGQVQLPTTFPYYIQIENEVVKVNSAPATSIGTGAANEYDYYDVNRAANGTLAEHAADATVYLLQDYTPPQQQSQLLPPTNVTANATSTTEIDLQWEASANATNSTGYLVYMKSDTTDWAPVGNTGATTFVKDGLSPNTHYYFCVFAYDGSVYSTYSNVADATTTDVSQPPLATPQNLMAQASSSSEVDMAWSAVEGATQYVVQARTQGGEWVDFGTATTNSFSRNDLSPNVTYEFQVKAVNSETSSDYSGTASALTYPSAPTSFSVQAVSSSQVNLSWDAQAGIGGYYVAYRTGSADWTYVNLAPGQTTYSVTSLSANTDYTFYVGAYNASGMTWQHSQDAVTANSDNASGPETPTGLTITQSGDNQLLVQWNAAAGASEYIVYYYNSGWQQLTVTANTQQYVNVNGSGTYYFDVIAGNGNGQYSTAAQYAGITI